MDENLRKKLRDRDYRAEFAESFLDDTLPLQIRSIRESRGLSQKELGDLTGMKQGAISRLERADYGAWSVATLKRIAKALDLPLSVKFESWSEFVKFVNNISIERLVPLEASKDQILTNEIRPQATDSTACYLNYIPGIDTTVRKGAGPIYVHESPGLYGRGWPAAQPERRKGTVSYAHHR